MKRRIALASLIVALILVTPNSVSAASATVLDAGWGYNCAVTTTGGVVCCGLGSEGQLGDGNGTSTDTDPLVAGPVGVRALGGGEAIASLDTF
jgi:alpha-tubulin suppressor-like RCC1 family protein